jgi:hypothetical protein
MPGVDVGGMLRSGVAALCLAAGVLHVSAAADHRGMAGHVAFFLAVAVVQSALATAVLWGRPGRWLAAGAVVNLAVAFVWVLSRTTGLPVDGSSAPEAIGFKDGISTMLEIGAAAGAGLWWLLPDGARRVGLPSGRLATAVLGTGVWAVGAGGLFAGHAHSPGHTHAGAAEHAHAAPYPAGAEQAHAREAGHHDDHAASSATGAATRPGDDGHAHTAAPDSATHDTAEHHHRPEARLAAITTSAAGGHDHGGSHQQSEAQPVPERAAGHHHDPVAADRGQPGDDHEHHHDEGGSGSDKRDEDGGASPLEDVLKLIRPR